MAGFGRLLTRKRYPQYDHCAVIVAEDITARFLNVIGLFNGVIPLIAIQMTALKVGDHLALLFTTVLDELTLGPLDEDEEKDVTDRAYWENRGTPATVRMADQLLEIIHTFDPQLELKYNKFYIGIAKEGQPNNFVIFRAKKKHLGFEPRLSQSEDTEKRLEEAGLDLMDYDKKWGRYRIRLTHEDVESHKELLTDMLRRSYQSYGT